jgi:hypothetical protein
MFVLMCTVITNCLSYIIFIFHLCRLCSLFFFVLAGAHRKGEDVMYCLVIFIISLWSQVFCIGALFPDKDTAALHVFIDFWLSVCIVLCLLCFVCAAMICYSVVPFAALSSSRIKHSRALIM